MKQKEEIIEVFKDDPNQKYMVIKIKDYWLNYNGGDIYETVRKWWKIKPNRANEYKYVLAVKCGTGKVLKVFEVDKNGWSIKRSEDGKWSFTGKEASKEIMDKYIGFKVSDKYRKRGCQNPVQYCKY